MVKNTFPTLGNELTEVCRTIQPFEGPENEDFQVGPADNEDLDVVGTNLVDLTKVVVVEDLAEWPDDDNLALFRDFVAN